MPGIFRRQSAMMMPGIFLSQPPIPTRPAKRLPRATSSMESAITSRETSEAFIPCVPIELVARGNLFDGLVGIGGCDKNMPGIIMALCRLDIPGMMLYGGSIAPGKLNGPSGEKIDITIQ